MQGIYRERVKERGIDYKNYDAQLEEKLSGEIISRHYYRKLSGEIITLNYQYIMSRKMWEL